MSNRITMMDTNVIAMLGDNIIALYVDSGFSKKRVYFHIDDVLNTRDEDDDIAIAVIVGMNRMGI